MLYLYHQKERGKYMNTTTFCVIWWMLAVAYSFCLREEEKIYEDVLSFVFVYIIPVLVIIVDCIQK
jgi:hypothetical protein